MHGNVTRQRCYTTMHNCTCTTVYVSCASILPSGIVALIANTDTFPFKWLSIKIYDYYFHSPFATDKFIMTTTIRWSDYILYLEWCGRSMLFLLLQRLPRCRKLTEWKKITDFDSCSKFYECCSVDDLSYSQISKCGTYRKHAALRAIQHFCINRRVQYTISIMRFIDAHISTRHHKYLWFFLHGYCSLLLPLLHRSCTIIIMVKWAKLLGFFVMVSCDIFIYIRSECLFIEAWFQ